MRFIARLLGAMCRVRLYMGEDMGYMLGVLSESFG